MRNKKPFFLSLFLCSVLFLTGCFGSRELDDLAFVMAVGIDKGAKPGTVRVTAQIARPGDVRGQTGAPSAGTGEPVWTAAAEGRTIFEAIRNIARFSSRRVFWAHNQVIVIGEDMAQEGISDVIDFFSRNHELRMKTWIVVSEGEAKKLVSTQTGLEVLPGVSINKLFRYSEIVSEAPKTDMRTLAAAYLSDSTHPVLARVAAKDRQISAKQKQEFGLNPQIELSGTAVFKRDKMVGFLDLDESRGLLWFVQNVESRVVVVPCPSGSEGGGQPISLEVKHATFNVVPKYENGKVSFEVKLDSNIDMVEVGCATGQDNSEIMKRVQADAKASLQGDIEAVLKAAQQTYKLDFLELGKVFQNRYPVEWQQLRKNWDQEFAKAEIKLQVDAHVNSPVLLQKPTRSGK